MLAISLIPLLILLHNIFDGSWAKDIRTGGGWRHAVGPSDLLTFWHTDVHLYFIVVKYSYAYLPLLSSPVTSSWWQMLCCILDYLVSINNLLIYMIKAITWEVVLYLKKNNWIWRSRLCSCGRHCLGSERPGQTTATSELSRNVAVDGHQHRVSGSHQTLQSWSSSTTSSYQPASSRGTTLGYADCHAMNYSLTIP